MVAGLMPGVFGLVMMVAPDAMLGNSLTAEVHPTTELVTRWVGFGAFSIGLITLLSRNDAGSPSLTGLMVGNAVFHSLGIGFDAFGYADGTMSASGLITGLVSHGLLLVGFAYYLLTPGPGTSTKPHARGRPGSPARGEAERRVQPRVLRLDTGGRHSTMGTPVRAPCEHGLTVGLKDPSEVPMNLRSDVRHA